MSSTDVIIPYWEGSSAKDLNNSLFSLKSEILLINKIIIVCDGENSFFKMQIKDKYLEHKILIIFLKNNQGPGNARNVGAIFSKAENLLFLDAGDININNRIRFQSKVLSKNNVSVGAIKEIDSLGLNRIKLSTKKIVLAKIILPYKNPFNNVSIGIKRNWEIIKTSR